MSNNEKLLPFWDGLERQFAFPWLPYSASRIFLSWFHCWDVLVELSHFLKLVENIVYLHLHVLQMEIKEQMQMNVYFGSFSYRLEIYTY